MARKRCRVENSIAVICPEVAKQWDSFKNGELTPEDVTPGSGKKVWWRCTVDKCGQGCQHSYKAKVAHKTNGRGCPFCSGKRICIHESLGYKFPDLAKQWDHENNKPLTPENVSAGSNKRVRWLCPVTNCEFKCVHSFSSTIINRTAPNIQSGCPYCATSGSIQTCEHNTFAYKHPELLQEWDWERNSIDPSTIRPMSNKKVWWRCPNTNCTERCPHVYAATVCQRVGAGSNCPFCAPNPTQICEHNSLAGKRLDVMKYWHKEKNHQYDPKALTSNSSAQVWWKCPSTCKFGCVHEWKAKVNSVSGGSGCPYCCKPPQRVCPHTSLAYLRKDIMEEWDSRNELDPTTVAVGSHSEARWICKTCTHEWQAVINNRTSAGNGCPKCRQCKMEHNMGIVLDSLTETLHPLWKTTRVLQNQRWVIRGLEVDKFVELEIHPSKQKQRIVIEMDGRQHFQSVEYFGGDEAFKKTQERDARKDKACHDQHLHLLRIACDVDQHCYTDIVRSFFDQVATHPDVWHMHCVGSFYQQQ